MSYKVEACAEYVYCIHLHTSLLYCWGIVEKALIARRGHIVVNWPSIFVADYINTGKLDGWLLFVGVSLVLLRSQTWLNLTYITYRCQQWSYTNRAKSPRKLIICLFVIIEFSFKYFCLKILFKCNVDCCWKRVLLKSFEL